MPSAVCTLSESEAPWDQFLGSLRDRGLSGVRLVIADARDRVAAQLADAFTEAQPQNPILVNNQG